MLQGNHSSSITNADTKTPKGSTVRKSKLLLVSEYVRAVGKNTVCVCLRAYKPDQEKLDSPEISSHGISIALNSLKYVNTSKSFSCQTPECSIHRAKWQRWTNVFSYNSQALHMLSRVKWAHSWFDNDRLRIPVLVCPVECVWWNISCLCFPLQSTDPPLAAVVWTALSPCCMEEAWANWMEGGTSTCRTTQSDSSHIYRSLR